MSRISHVNNVFSMFGRVLGLMSVNKVSCRACLGKACHRVRSDRQGSEAGSPGSNTNRQL
jgi:hypothetical protein